MNSQQFNQRVLAWFKKEGRKDLPWQQSPTPYTVWLSEIMLQQTQVVTVIPYYQRFLRHYPSVTELAHADLDEVLALWSGLGYYARARNLHKAAQTIVHNYRGVFPEDYDRVLALPGIGRSTAGAILSLATGQHHAILDGNVKRVLARVFMLPGWPGNARVAEEFWRQASRLTPARRTAHYNQAMMDLGATLCTRSRPQCGRCPVKSLCAANKAGCQHQYPHKKPRKSLPVKQTNMLMLLNHRQEILLQKRPPAGIWGGLLSFPEIDPDQNVSTWCRQRLGVVAHNPRIWAVVRHTFSHFHLDITPIRAEVKTPIDCVMEEGPWVWYKDNKITGGMAAPVIRLLDRLMSEET